jgi:hypothetical protein
MKVKPPNNLKPQKANSDFTYTENENVEGL